MSCIGDEESDEDVSAEVEKQVHDLTHSAAALQNDVFVKKAIKRL
jgi:hypothetical protein